MQRRRTIGAVAALLTMGVGAWLAAGAWLKRGTEEPSYELLGREGDVELRSYGPSIVAVTEVEGEREAALNVAFRRLAGYIFGGNRQKAKVAMTAPVAAQASEKIAMTAPVAATPKDGKWRVTFTMPASYSMDTLPEPLDPSVRLETTPPRTVAALRFSGRARTADVEAKTQELEAALARAGKKTRGAPTLAQYDPPFTMPPMRRNEILVELE